MVLAMIKITNNFIKCGANNCVGYIVREGSRWRLKKGKR